MKDHTRLLLEKAENAIRAAETLLDAEDSERIQGDYQVAPQMTDEDVEVSLGQARQFLAEARKFLQQVDDHPATDGDT